MPATSLPAIGCAGTNDAMWSLRTRRAASTTSRLVEPTSIISAPSSMPWRIALNVASVADTGTAMRTMSDPETASSSNISVGPPSVRVDRVGAEQLEEGTGVVQLCERAGDVRLVGVAVDVDVEV